MAKTLDIEIKEDITELLSLLHKQHTILKRSRIKALVLIKQGKVTYSKDLSKKLKYDRRTIYNWLKLYEKKGIEGLISVKSGGNNTPLILDKTKRAIIDKLNDPDTSPINYVDLLKWVQENHQENISYGALYKFCKTHNNYIDGDL